MYLLPKNHNTEDTLKQYDNIDGIGPDNIHIPGCPIISQCEGPFNRVSKYLDYFLIPIVKSKQWYVRDLKQIVNFLEDLEVPENTILSIYDITSMYMNCHFSKVLKAVEEAISSSSIKYDIKNTPINTLWNY